MKIIFPKAGCLLFICIMLCAFTGCKEKTDDIVRNRINFQIDIPKLNEQKEQENEPKSEFEYYDENNK